MLNYVHVHAFITCIFLLSNLIQPKFYTVKSLQQHISCVPFVFFYFGIFHIYSGIFFFFFFFFFFCGGGGIFWDILKNIMGY